jgi:hypothetical protein
MPRWESAAKTMVHGRFRSPTSISSLSYERLFNHVLTSNPRPPFETGVDQMFSQPGPEPPTPPEGTSASSILSVRPDHVQS